ncbi:S9 family peptidase [Usitatibacter palustris]|uniref:Dipeptidyl aminopeptidase BIII n=1 Tax=Usitatibacter palustris TaxID=2732487 RepID=A0A6M4HCB3_9PROT|nr:S9 family peptidase [Usitatibacter palustris]QJR16882.1 Dipeptidyl aminopeptidase BIII [Usitatibacter palustris]
MRFLKALLVAVTLAGIPAGFASAAPVPLRDFFKNPAEVSHSLSPDGQWIAYRAPYERRLNIFVRPVKGGEAKRITSETARDIAGFAWKGNDRLIYAKDFGGDENFHIVSVDRNGEGLKDLTPFEKVRAGIVDDLKDHPTDMLISHNKRDAKVFDVYRVNIATGDSKMVAENPGNIVGWLTDHDGKVRVATTTDGVNTSLLYREAEDQPFKTVLTTNFRENVNPEFFTFDNKKLYAISNRGRDKAAVVIFDPATAKEEVIYERQDVDVSSVSYSRKRKVLTASRYVTWKSDYHFFDKEVEALFRDVQAKLPGYEVAIASWNKNEDVFIVGGVNDKTRGKRYLYDTKTKAMTQIADVSPWLVESQLADMKPIQYKSRDGLTIHGYLTLPKGVAAKNLPVVVNPHGGPWYRDNWGFNPEVQFLANRGYAVFQMNFRGSTGYGRKFWEASFKQWGKTMQDDVTDGVQWLIKEGIADPKRIAIYGGSYGGYTTLAGITFTPDLYAAAVDYVGVSNLFTFLNTIPPYWKPYLDMFHEMVGHPEKDKALLTSASPALHADKIKTPLFIAQGAKDPRVNKDESDQMVAAMKKRGVEVEYLVKDNEGHGFRNEENRFEFYEAMEKFLKKHVGT